MANVRSATKKDVSAILGLLDELGRPKASTKSAKVAFEKQFMYYLKQKQLAVAEIDSKVVGLVSIILVRRLNRASLELYIPELVVSTDYRKMGIGKLLINHCIDLAKKKGCFRIRLESGNQRTESHKFYRNLGFIQYAKTFTLEIKE